MCRDIGKRLAQFGVHRLVLVQRGSSEQDVLKFLSECERDLIGKV